MLSMGLDYFLPFSKKFKLIIIIERLRPLPIYRHCEVKVITYLSSLRGPERPAAIYGCRGFVWIASKLRFSQ